MRRSRGRVLGKCGGVCVVVCIDIYIILFLGGRGGASYCFPPNLLLAPPRPTPALFCGHQWAVALPAGRVAT